jgi:hypothetical protein
MPILTWIEYPDHLEGHVTHADGLAHGVFASEKLLDHRASRHGHARGRAGFRLGEEIAVGDLPVADLGVAHAGADDLRGPVLVLVDDLGSP